MPADEVKKNSYYKPLPLLPIDKLKIKSEARVKDNLSFAEVKKFAHILEEERRRDSAIISLKWSDYAKSMLAAPDTRAELKKMEQPTSTYIVENSLLDKEKIKSDAYLRDNNGKWLQRIGTDIYVQECFNILTDYINLIANKTN